MEIFTFNSAVINKILHCLVLLAMPAKLLKNKLHQVEHKVELASTVAQWQTLRVKYWGLGGGGIFSMHGFGVRFKICESFKYNA